jgi:hypothetical protein
MQIRAWNTLHDLMAVILDVESVANSRKRFVHNNQIWSRIKTAIIGQTVLSREARDGRSPFADRGIPGSYHLEITVARGVEKTFGPRLY